MLIISVFHTLLTIFVVFYGYFTKKNKFDFFYLFYGYSVILSWTFFNGECFISYYYKKLTNSTDNSIYSHDLDAILGKKYETILRKYHEPIFKIVEMLLLVSFYLVMVRQMFPMMSIFILLLIHASYYITIINNMHFHVFFRILSIGGLLYILSRWK